VTGLACSGYFYFYKRTTYASSETRATISAYVVCCGVNFRDVTLSRHGNNAVADDFALAAILVDAFLGSILRLEIGWFELLALSFCYTGRILSI
jgi:hypothetical protein